MRGIWTFYVYRSTPSHQNAYYMDVATFTFTRDGNPVEPFPHPGAAKLRSWRTLTDFFPRIKPSVPMPRRMLEWISIYWGSPALAAHHPLHNNIVSLLPINSQRVTSSSKDKIIGPFFARLMRHATIMSAWHLSCPDTLSHMVSELIEGVNNQLIFQCRCKVWTRMDWMILAMKDGPLFYLVSAFFLSPSSPPFLADGVGIIRQMIQAAKSGIWLWEFV